MTEKADDLTQVVQLAKKWQILTGKWLLFVPEWRIDVPHLESLLTVEVSEKKEHMETPVWPKT